MFNERKVAQIAAYLLAKGGNQYAHLKLMKLLYLADRESLRLHGASMTGDKPVSMRHGPVLSCTLDLINGSAKSQENGWDNWISDSENYEVSTRRAFTRDDLDELSAADLEILDNVWDQFGYMDKWQIRDWTHDNLPEWEDPNGSSVPIPLKRIFTVLGKSPAAAEELKSDIDREVYIDRLFASL